MAQAAAGVRPLSSVLKTFGVLEALAEARGSVRLADLARRMGMGRGSAYQKLVTLVRAGWVEQIEDGSFRLTLHATRIGNAALEQASFGDRMVPFLHELMRETGETASLAVLDGAQPCIVQRVESGGVLRAELRVGAALSLEHSASGRILAAFAAPYQLERLRQLGAVLPPAAVMAEARAKRFVTSSGESMPGIRAIGAPIFDPRDRCIAALTLVGPLPRFDVVKHREALTRTAERINAFIRGHQA
ncbi:MAG TPA: IclR family transcriptional regulator [Stellaceae bacterium]|nr:IclR family transcriptional regulator [Stellaceae bacterium]